MNGPAGISVAVRRATLAAVLGQFGPADARRVWPLAGERYAHERTALGALILRGVGESDRREAQGAVGPLLSRMSSVFELLCAVAPELRVEAEAVSIAPEHWCDWLDSSWPIDFDLLVMLAAIRAGSDTAALAKIGSTLPFSWFPLGVPPEPPLSDAHIHFGSLVPPLLTWASVMSSGVVPPPANVRGHPESHAKEIAVRETLGAARVLLAALACAAPADAETGAWPTGKASSASVVAAMSEMLAGGERAALIRALRHLFPDDADIGELLASDEVASPPEGFQLTTFVQRERRTISAAIYRARHGELPPEWAEVLLSYLRAKNRWIRLGADAASNQLGLDGFRIARKVARVGTEAVDARQRAQVSAALADHFSAPNAVGSLDVRLPVLAIASIPPSVRWLTSALANCDWQAIVSIPRRDAEAYVSGQPNFEKEHALEFTRRLASSLGDASRIGGVDVVGAELEHHWDDVFDTLASVRACLREELGQEAAFIAVHCGEDTHGGIKGMCDIWRAAEELQLGEGDRIGHAVDLLRRRPWAEMYPSYEQWMEFDEAMPRMVASLAVPGLEELWGQVRATKTNEPQYKRVKVTGPIAELEDLVRVHLADWLIGRGIAIEACPTSNWRIAGTGLPTSHPGGWWRNRGGRLLVGTDDPGTMPCTIAGESLAMELATSAAGAQPPTA